MIFIYILIGALVGITIVLGIEHSLSQKSLLQIVKNWCNIDSVLFEGNLKKTHIYIVDIHRTIRYLFKKNLNKITSYSNQQGRLFRSLIRKKLHPKKNKQNSSHFIKKMKEK